MNRRSLYLRVAVFVVAATVTAPFVLAQGLGQGRGGGKPSAVGEEETGNNLSVPVVFVPDASGGPTLRLGCAGAQAPGADGQPSSNVYAGYWLQKTDATWSADCWETGAVLAHSVPVAADWGDNLTTRPNLPAGKPVRVEVSLLDDSTNPLYNGLVGYAVTNLTPNLADRLAIFGTRGDSGDAFFTGDPGAPFTKFFDSGAALTIEELDSQGVPIAPALYDGPMTAEVNSIGAVIYGFNWGMTVSTSTPGLYKLTFTTNFTNIVHLTDEATLNTPVIEGNGVATSLIIELTSSSGGGGGRGGGGGGGGRGGGGGGGNGGGGGRGVGRSQ